MSRLLVELQGQSKLQGHIVVPGPPVNVYACVTFQKVLRVQS